MNNVKAIGFDLFNTLVTVKPHALDEALGRLTASLGAAGLEVDAAKFRADHRRAALQFIEQSRVDGRETHNRFWISAALQAQDYLIAPDDARITRAVEDYFSAFFDFTELIPGTEEMLTTFRSRYPVGLLSNFTHAPAARKLLAQLDISRFFDVILISGEDGFRKPHSSIFFRLANGLGVKPQQLAYVGDDPEPDVEGARAAGMQPIWTTYVRDRNIAFAPGVASEQAHGVNGEVPRISSWEELLGLFGLRA